MRRLIVLFSVSFLLIAALPIPEYDHSLSCSNVAEYYDNYVTIGSPPGKIETIKQAIEYRLKGFHSEVYLKADNTFVIVLEKCTKSPEEELKKWNIKDYNVSIVDGSNLKQKIYPLKRTGKEEMLIILNISRTIDEAIKSYHKFGDLGLRPKIWIHNNNNLATVIGLFTKDEVDDLIDFLKKGPYDIKPPIFAADWTSFRGEIKWFEDI